MTGRLRKDRALVGPNARAGVARTVKTYFAVPCEDAVVGEVKVPLVNNNIRSGGRGRMVKGQRVSDDRCIGRSDHGKISQFQGHVQRDVVEYAIVQEQTTVRATNGSVVDGAAEIISARLKVDAVDGAQGAVEKLLFQCGVCGSDGEGVEG